MKKSRTKSCPADGRALLDPDSTLLLMERPTRLLPVAWPKGADTLL